MKIRHDEWLSLTKEEPIDPDFPILDSHHHLWDGPGDRGRYLLDEFLNDAREGHNIVKSIFVECGAMYRKGGAEEKKPIGETEFAQGMAAQSASGQYGMTGVAAAIVGYADLTLGERVMEVLESHIIAGSNRFRGIRQSCTWDDDPAIVTMGKASHMMTDEKFRKGFACLQKYGLVFDAWQYFTQLKELADLARKYPDTIIVVNHTGGPLGIGKYAGKEKEVFQEWKKGINELASCTNTVMKLGGLGMPRCGFGWHEREMPPTSAEVADRIKPYVLYCIENFGVERCMFESNFPVDRSSYSYTVLWNAFKLVCREFTQHETSALFYDTAMNVYNPFEDGK